jgi:hypothetical protein
MTSTPRVPSDSAVAEVSTTRLSLLLDQREVAVDSQEFHPRQHRRQAPPPDLILASSILSADGKKFCYAATDAIRRITQLLKYNRARADVSGVCTSGAGREFVPFANTPYLYLFQTTRSNHRVSLSCHMNQPKGDAIFREYKH